MKKLLSLLLVLSLVFILVACSGNTDADMPESEPEEIVSTVDEEASAPPVESQLEADENNNSQPEPVEDQQAGGESRAEVQQTAAAPEASAQPVAEPAQNNDTATGGKTLVVYMSHTNTTATVVGHITDAIDADVFVIVPTNAYPSSYNEHLDMAQQELSDDVRPTIQSNVANMDEYDTILLGYPIWWGYAPRPVATFLESHDLSGKTIAPFCTSGSSGMGQSASEIARLAPGAEVVSGLSITSGNTGNGESLVRDWLSNLSLL